MECLLCQRNFFGVVETEVKMRSAFTWTQYPWKARRDLKACFRSYPVSLLTFQMREKAAFLLIFFRKGNIMKRKLGTANR